MRLGVHSHASPCSESGNIIVEGVYQREDGRWEVHFIEGPDWETWTMIEARCHPSCQRGAGGPHIWVSPEHQCCEACKIDSGHRYQSVHE